MDAFRIFVTVLCWGAGFQHSAISDAASPESDQYALDAIFNDQLVIDSGWDVHQRAMSLEREARYLYLHDWVLPNEEHATFRIQYGFSPTHPAPPVDHELLSSEGQLGPRAATGGRLISPVYDLLGVASDLGRMDELSAILSAPTIDKSVGGQTDWLAFAILLHLKSGQIDLARERLEEFLVAAAPPSEGIVMPRPSEFVVYHAAVEHPELRAIVGDAVYRYAPWVNEQYDKPVEARHWSSMIGKARVQAVSDEVSDQPDLSEWSISSRATAQTRGRGCPIAKWDVGDEWIENIASHDDDYLMYQIPLRGDFQVECDVTPFGWRDSGLSVAGYWVMPVYTEKDYDWGTYRLLLGRRPIEPPLSKIGRQIHYRTEIRDKNLSTFFNGRQVHQQPLSGDHSPWVAVRSAARQDGAVRNLRITGSPVVPESVALSEDQNLYDWVSYDMTPVNEGTHGWQWRDGVIHGFGSAFHTDAKVGQDLGLQPQVGHVQRLLRYQRPMFEDGSIEYEFLYEPGKSECHPALDRLAMILTPDGVLTHWITDGKFERTNLSPSNTTLEQDAQLGDHPLSLKDGEWNAVRLSIEGETVRLELNGELIFERPIETTNQRTFGIFHYVDRAEAHVRDVVMRGNWPKQLPELNAQEMFIAEAEFLDRDTEHLTATFEHDFVDDDDWFKNFVITRGDPYHHFQQTDRGLEVTRPGSGGYRNATISAALQLGGDFDIVAEYAEYRSTPSVEGSAQISLLALLDREQRDQHLISRRHYPHEDGRDRHYCQCVVVRQAPDGERRNYFSTDTMEESSGRLRLTRRGETVYYLTAEGDSPNFRLRGQIPASDVDVLPEGVRLIAQIHQLGGEVHVVWKKLSIKAERLSGRAIDGADPRLAEFEKHRKTLTDKFSIDFTKSPPPPSIEHRNPVSDWNATDKGWRIRSVGAQSWTAGGFHLPMQVEGDFDINVKLTPTTLIDGPPGYESSIYVQLEFPNQDRTQISGVFQGSDNGNRRVNAQMRTRKDGGGYNYGSIGAIDLATISGIRFVRQGTDISMIVSSDHLQDDYIVTTHEFPDLPIRPYNIRFMAHTEGAGNTSEVTVKSIDIRAEKLSGVPRTATPRPAPPAPKPKSTFESFLDLFR